MKPMTRAPSNDPSLARDGSWVEAMPTRGDDAKPPVSVPSGIGSKGRLPETLRLIHRLALTIATVVICALFASPGAARATAIDVAGASASLLAAAADVPMSGRANAEQASKSSHHWHDRSSRPSADFKAVEVDGDDDDDEDPQCELIGGASVAFRCLPAPRRPDGALRGELQLDTSRFAAGTGLPRGPPA
jgi:hypothetical protein